MTSSTPTTPTTGVAAEAKEGGVLYDTPFAAPLQVGLPATYTVRPRRPDSQLSEAEERVYGADQFAPGTQPDTGSERQAPYYQPPPPPNLRP